MSKVLLLLACILWDSVCIAGCQKSCSQFESYLNEIKQLDHVNFTRNQTSLLKINF